MVERFNTDRWWPAVYDPIRKAGEKVAQWFAPASEASASEEAYRINLELPGVKVDDIDISVHDGTLSVKGEKRFERVEEDDDYFFSEREYGSFRRTYRLPPDADEGSVSANFKDGVLAIKVQKLAAPAERSRKVEIKAG